MTKIKVSDFAELVKSEHCNSSQLIKNIIHKFCKNYVYIPFFDEKELENLIKNKCDNLNWDYEKVTAIYVRPENKPYSSCMIIGDYTIEELVNLIKKVSCMKAFL